MMWKTRKEKEKRESRRLRKKVGIVSEASARLAVDTLHHLAASQPAIVEDHEWNSSYYNQQEYSY